MAKKTVAGNWKMHGSASWVAQHIEALLEADLPVDAIDVIVAPTYVHLPSVLDRVGGNALKVAAQDARAEADGAFTGDVSAAMLADIGVTDVILGHSERRHGLGESNALVGEKVAATLAAGLRPIICVGETQAEREVGNASEVVLAQLEAAVAGIEAEAINGCLVAYEPVWAIGTGLTASPEQAQEMHQVLRERLRDWVGDNAASVPLLYGGSVKGENAAGLFAKADIDGALVGGASLKVDEFAAICRAAADA